MKMTKNKAALTIMVGAGLLIGQSAVAAVDAAKADQPDLAIGKEQIGACRRRGGRITHTSRGTRHAAWINPPSGAKRGLSTC